MIKENRQKNNYSQEELAEILGISTRQLQRIEKNENETRITTLKKIIEILHIPDEEIIEYIHRKEKRWKNQFKNIVSSSFFVVP